MTKELMKVNLRKLSEAVTCYLCNKWLRNAATITECCHSFCRECIEKKLIDEKLNHCPVCNTDLGCSPLDKLRSDTRKQELRDKIFPFQDQNDEEPAAKLLAKIKKNLVSSLKPNREISKAGFRKVLIAEEADISSPKLDKVEGDKEDENQGDAEFGEEGATIGSARRAKAAARIKFICSAQPPGQEKTEGDQPRVETSSGTLKIRIPNLSKPNTGLRNEKADMFEPINSQVGAGRKRKSRSHSTMQENGVTSVLVHSNDDDPQVGMVQIDNHGHKTNGNQKGSIPSSSDSVKPIVSTREKRPKISEDLNFPAPSETDSDSESSKEFGPIWFCLVAAEEKKGSAPLPQLSSCYLRVKDGSVTVSCIKKYLVKKLGLASETEVEITLQGQPVLSSLQLNSLVDIWLKTVPKNEILTSFGSSAKDFIMVLSYGRKA
ncbi:E3 ubiquitin protein ligase DRIP2 [Vigna radiata var. radiata]|uniref:E3 ubiquitin protein ligase DRIP2 n=1 Tax=Vigna radiata var. radiata TaxID=3916 RepID=A0A3Q0FDP6_VIGRR|nr:E3 ubiquitin protein ligase DRIP2 [Vigna radiata var. radiata]